MRIEGKTIVGEVLDKYPGTLEVFLKFGFTPLKDPVLRKTMPYQVTIERASKMHNVDLEEFLRALNQAVRGKA